MVINQNRRKVSFLTFRSGYFAHGIKTERNSTPVVEISSSDISQTGIRLDNNDKGSISGVETQDYDKEAVNEGSNSNALKEQNEDDDAQYGDLETTSPSGAITASQPFQ
jgi:hypothetical protein